MLVHGEEVPLDVTAPVKDRHQFDEELVSQHVDPFFVALSGVITTVIVKIGQFVEDRRDFTVRLEGFR